MEILQSTLADIPAIFRIYDQATAHQKLVGNNHWKGFERSLLEMEIGEGRQWKIIIDNQIACVFCLADDDPLIWKEKNEDAAVYIHRIATNPDFRGLGLVKQIIRWVEGYAKQHHKDFIRIDTGAGNEKLNSYYISCGFNYLGVTQLEDTRGLPEHYKDGAFSLFEIKVTN